MGVKFQCPSGTETMLHALLKTYYFLQQQPMHGDQLQRRFKFAALLSLHFAYTEVFPSLEKVVHAASALSGVAAVCAVEPDTHFQWHTRSNQTATACVNSGVAVCAACR